jgi:Zn-dependent protease with chaperone function
MTATSVPRTREVFARVLAAAGRPALALDLAVDARVFAYTQPGRVVLSYGLLACCDEREVAGVLAHEVAHRLMDHGRVEARERDVLLADAAALLRVSGEPGALAMAVVALTVGAAEACRGRRHEVDADVVGEAIARAAGFEGGLARFLARFGNGTSGAAVFDSHPSALSRLQALRAAVARRSTR